MNLLYTSSHQIGLVGKLDTLWLPFLSDQLSITGALFEPIVKAKDYGLVEREESFD